MSLKKCNTVHCDRFGANTIKDERNNIIARYCDDHMPVDVKDTFGIVKLSIGGRIDDLLEAQRSHYLSAIERAVALTESPIEAAMVGALMTEWGIACGEPPRLVSRCDPASADIQIAAQPLMPPYRPDIAIMANHRCKKAIIECDGHEFHERTKEQAASDKARDNWFQVRGWHVFRFTGSQIVENAWKCAETVGEYLLGVHNDRGAA